MWSGDRGVSTSQYVRKLDHMAVMSVRGLPFGAAGFEWGINHTA